MRYFILTLLLSFTLSCAQEYSNQRPVRAANKDLSKLVHQVHFNTNKAKVKSRDLKHLDQNAVWFNKYIDEIVILEGHCDERGPSRYNMDLGDRRARWVKSYLIKKGVNPRKIIVISYGESKPLDTAHNHKAWRKNRRVVFRLGR